MLRQRNPLKWGIFTPFSITVTSKQYNLSIAVKTKYGLLYTKNGGTLVATHFGVTLPSFFNSVYS